jgi:putative ABC transport system permease protein
VSRAPIQTLRMAWRETRGAGRHVAHVLACITLGVAALVAVGSFGDSVARTIAGSARSLTGGDIEIRGPRPLVPEAAQAVSDLGARGVVVARVRELSAMASAPEHGGGPPRSLLVELKAVGTGYPLYGRVVADPDRPLDELIGRGRALVHESFLLRLGLRAGDRFRLGASEFAVSAVIRDEPDRALGLFALGPRVIIANGDLEATGFVQPGSRIRYRTLLRLPDTADPDPIRDALAERVGASGRVTTYSQAQPGLRRVWGQLTSYLGLTGLVALLVGGIGVGAGVGTFIAEKVMTIAVLKCLGARWRAILATYLVQTAGLGLAGSLIGAALGSALQPLLEPILRSLLPFPVALAVSPGAVLRGIAMGVGVTLLCALWPLLAIRRVPPALILRRQVDRALPGREPWLAAAPIVLGLAGLAVWQAGSLKIGLWFIGGFGAGLLLLLATSRLAIAAARRLPRLGSLSWRQGVATLHRPGSHAGVVLVSMGLAVMLIVAVALLDRSLRAQLAERSGRQAPAFFFIDVQRDQVEAFRRIVRAESGSDPEVIPVVRSRLAAVNGAPVARAAANRREEWQLAREYVLTWAAEPPGRNTVVAGRWWSAEEARREALISVEEEIAHHLGVSVGDTLTFDVQGVPVAARIANLRRVDWRTFDANFFVIFSPGPLDGAPGSFIATARVSPDAEHRVQSAVVSALPNVTAIPIREVLARLTRIMEQIALAVRLVAAFTIVVGLIVLVGALTATRYQRLYQSVILKTLGATRGLVARVFAVEYALLGALAGLGGTALAGALAWAVLHFVFDIPWTWQPATLAASIAASTALAVLVGFLATFRLLGERPLRVLRGE